jgi:hypothetical protein
MTLEEDMIYHGIIDFHEQENIRIGRSASSI